MNKGRIIFRVDGSTQVGLGHLLRCFSLAQLLNKEYQIKFFSIELPESIKKNFEEFGISCYRIKKEKDFFEFITSSDIVVVDHYLLGRDWQIKAKSLASKLICIDDLQNLEYVADLIINHNPYVLRQEYRAEKYTKFALGFKYALIRPVFKVAAGIQKRIFKNEEILICLGGSDNLNLTKSIVETVSIVKPDAILNVIVGQAYMAFNELSRSVLGNPKIRLFKGIDANEMCNLMMGSSIAIVSASGVLIETLCANCRIIGCYYAINQKSFHDHLLRDRIILSFGDNSEVFQKENFINCLKASTKLNYSKISEYRQQIIQSDQNLISVIREI